MCNDYFHRYLGPIPRYPLQCRLIQILYALQAAVPDKELKAITSCFWIKTQHSSHRRSDQPTVLSYAVRRTDNEFLIYLRPQIAVIVKDEFGQRSFK